MSLIGQVALVTGGAKRVGRAIVLELGRAGCDMAIHYRSSRQEAEETAALVTGLGCRAALVQGDLNEPSAWPSIIDSVVGKFGRLDVLINNASLFDPDVAMAAESTNVGADSTSPTTGPHALAHTTPLETTGDLRGIAGFDGPAWERLFRVNAIAPAGLAHYARPHLERHGRGRIVNLCDISAERPWPSYLGYCASKAALVALTKGLARAFAPTITVNGVSPGIAVFPAEYPASLRAELVARVPLGREGTPEEVAHMVRFLVASGEYITGQVIAVDGGRSIV